MGEGCKSSVKQARNCGCYLSYHKDSFHQKQEQALGSLAHPQTLDTNDQLSSTAANRQDVTVIHQIFGHPNAMKGFLHHVH